MSTGGAGNLEYTYNGNHHDVNEFHFVKQPSFSHPHPPSGILAHSLPRTDHNLDRSSLRKSNTRRLLPFCCTPLTLSPLPTFITTASSNDSAGGMSDYCYFWMGVVRTAFTRKHMSLSSPAQHSTARFGANIWFSVRILGSA
jgi:hypothetical protein